MKSISAHFAIRSLAIGLLATIATLVLPVSLVYSDDVDSNGKLVLGPKDLAGLDVGDVICADLNTEEMQLQLVNENGESDQLTETFHDIGTDRLAARQDRLLLRCPATILKQATDWMQKVKAAHDNHEGQVECHVLLPSDPKILKQIFDWQAVDLNEGKVKRNEVPSLRFKFYCGGRVMEGKESNSQKRIVVSRLVIATTPTPVAAKSIQQKLSLPGRAFEKTTSFSVDCFDIGLIGPEEFGKELWNRYGRGYLQSVCLGKTDAILEANRSEYQKTIGVVRDHNSKLPTDEEINAKARELCDSVSDAKKGARIIISGPGKKLRLATQEILRGTSDPLVQIQIASASLKSLKTHVSEPLRQYFEAEVFGKQAFLGIDYDSVYLIDGNTAYLIIKNLVSGMRLDSDAKGDTEAIDETTTHFAKLTPQIPQPALPSKPSEPVDPYAPDSEAAERYVSAIAEKIGNRQGEDEDYERMQEVIALHKEAVAEHANRIKSGYYDSDPRWQAYLKARSAYPTLLRDWETEVESILGPWRSNNAKLAKIWPNRKAVVMSELQSLRTHRTKVRVKINESERKYESRFQTTNSRSTNNDEPVTFVPDLFPYLIKWN